MTRRMWFGSKRFARWIKVHSPGSAYSSNGHMARVDYLSGGVGLRRSTSGHEALQLTWNRLSGQEARDITDFAFSTYGDGPFYLSDPGTQRLNVLNKQWSMPGLTGKDGVPLTDGKRPNLVTNYDQSRRYPVDMAQYQISDSTVVRTFYAPVPPGHVAWVGAHGDPASTLGIRVQPTVAGVTAGVSSVVSVIGVDTSQRVTHSFPASSDQAGIEISIQEGVAGTITLAGIVVQVLPANATPELGDFISGQGMNGADFDGIVRPTPYSYAHDSYGLAVNLVETDDWI